MKMESWTLHGKYLGLIAMYDVSEMGTGWDFVVLRMMVVCLRLSSSAGCAYKKCVYRMGHSGNKNERIFKDLETYYVCRERKSRLYPQEPRLYIEAILTETIQHVDISHTDARRLCGHTCSIRFTNLAG
jgi:hypothetical protein